MVSRLPPAANHPALPAAVPHHPGRPTGCPRADKCPWATSGTETTRTEGLKSSEKAKIAKIADIADFNGFSPPSRACRNFTRPAQGLGHLRTYILDITSPKLRDADH